MGLLPLPRAFLDLAHESTHLGRVIIKVLEGIWGLNFLYMCAGGMGPSYANSRVFDVFCKGGTGEHIVMGHYVSHGARGTSTQAVLSSEEDWERERGREREREKEIYKQMPRKAGEVRGDTSYEEASQLRILTRDDPGWECGGCFLGMVEGGGMNVLRKALNYWDSTNVKVVNCGLIFSM
ncbi:uncharacterized protein [Macrobrachium rosenbergii]|uniref:uncharacterized protein isoform X1 n=1 Tax=Macrobrachium rosenbergii TaxID=79674 RepID=UPI0034D51AEB